MRAAPTARYAAVMSETTGIVALRDVTDADLPIFFEHQRDEDAVRMAASPTRERDAYFAHWRERVLANPDARTRTIVVDDAVAGYVGSWDDDGTRLVAYWIGREYWGRGVATAALRAFLEIDTARPLHAYVAAHNAGSMRVLERCGFRRVGDATMGEDGVAECFYRLDGGRTSPP